MLSGIGYAMMTLVQLNKQTEFDRVYAWYLMHMAHRDITDYHGVSGENI